MMVFGLPSAKISAAPDAAESMPRVTMKSVILPQAMMTPLTIPTRSPVATAATSPPPAGRRTRSLTEHHGQRHHRGDRQVDARGGHHERLADRQHHQGGGRGEHDVRFARAEERRVERLENDARATSPVGAAQVARLAGSAARPASVGFLAP